MKDLALGALDLVARRGVSYADVRAVDSREREISTKNGKAGHVSSSESQGIGIRVLAGGCWGFAATDRLTADGIESAAALARLKKRPDVVLVDGQGLAHPRGLGLATHLGLVADIPTSGVAKSRLVGAGQIPPLAAGSYNELILKGKVVGLILRTRTGKNPLYLSPGHRITLPECLEITLGCVTTYRLPLPVRQADLLSRRLRRLGPEEALA